MNTVRLAVLRDGKMFARPFNNVNELEREVLRTGALSTAHLSDLQQKFNSWASWQSPDPVTITDEQIKQLKLQRVA